MAASSRSCPTPIFKAAAEVCCGLNVNFAGRWPGNTMHTQEVDPSLAGSRDKSASAPESATDDPLVAAATERALRELLEMVPGDAFTHFKYGRFLAGRQAAPKKPPRIFAAHWNCNRNSPKPCAAWRRFFPSSGIFPRPSACFGGPWPFGRTMFPLCATWAMRW